MRAALLQRYGSAMRLASVAAMAAGLNETAALQSTKTVKLSSGDEHNQWRIEPSEPFRVYPSVAEQRRGTDAWQSGEEREPPPATAAFEAEITVLRQMSELLRAQLEDIRRDRDEYRAQLEHIRQDREELRERLEEVKRDRDAWRDHAGKFAPRTEAPAKSSRRWRPFRRG
jgi:FtsZ-binding cell division protein ZapB